MARILLAGVLVLSSIVLACSKPKAPPPDGLALEPGFEDTCEPSVGPELAPDLPAAGISFEFDSIRIWSRAFSAGEIRAHAALVRGEGRSES